MAARQEDISAAVAPVPTDMIDESEPLNDKLLMMLAIKLDTKFMRFGVTLGVTPERIQHIEYECRRDVPFINFSILKLWRDNLRGNKQINDMYDTLCSSLDIIGRGDLCDFLRNDQVQKLGAEMVPVNEQTSAEWHGENGTESSD